MCANTLIPSHLYREQGSATAGKLITAAGFVVFAYFAFFHFFGQIVPPNTIGLRQNKITFWILDKGFSPKGLTPGLHWKFPYVSEVHLLHRDFQFVHFNDRQIPGNFTQPQLEIPTTDGSKVQSDVTMIVRFFEKPQQQPDIKPEGVEIVDEELTEVPLALQKMRSHGGPAELVNTYGLPRAEDNRQLKLFSLTAEEHLKKALSRLSTTDYYNPILRETAAIAANDAINEAVNRSGIETWATLVRRYVYSEKNIDDQIFAKNLQEQTERLNAAQRALQKAKAETAETVAKWDAEIKDLRVQGQQEKEVIMSEATRYEVERKSEGDRLVEEAYASVDKAKNEILAKTPGADVYLAREMTPLVSTLQGGIVTNIDPFDVDSWAKKLIPVQKGRAQAVGQ